jgi:hypothetical protein
MIPRPIHKWKSFWLGILVLGFLGWAWARSMHEGVTLVLWEDSLLSFRSIFGRLDISYISPSVPQYPVGLDCEEVAPDPGDYLPVAVYFLKNGFTTTVEIACWFLILLFLVPWVGFLAWRVRKQRKPSL